MRLLLNGGVSSLKFNTNMCRDRHCIFSPHVVVYAYHLHVCNKSQHLPNIALTRKEVCLTRIKLIKFVDKYMFLYTFSFTI